jgi:Ser/Thr protein kinase RdoA (MazF antagonist)
MKPLEELASALRARYGFEGVDVGERLEGGFANDLFRVVADGQVFVLRIMYSDVIEEDVVWQHRVVRSLADRLSEVQAPVAALNGETFFTLEGRAAWLIPFVDGTPADAARRDHRRQAASALGRLHRAGASLTPAPRPRLQTLAELAWPPPVVPRELEEWRADILEMREWAIDYVADLAVQRRLPTSLIHGDFFPGNVLLADGSVVALLDWDEANVDWLTWDLANAVGTFCSIGDTLDRTESARFVAWYREAGGTAPPDDDDLLVPLVRVRRILEVLRARTDRVPRWEHQRRNLRSLSNLAGCLH